MNCAAKIVPAGFDAADDLARHGTLLDLIAELKSRNYSFVTPTPATHARVLARREGKRSQDLRDIFGWSIPFDRHDLPEGLFSALQDSGWIDSAEGAFRSKVRISSLGPDLFAHSAYPTDDQDAVFFGPDSYRFARLIERELARCPERGCARLLDIGSGSGVGAVVAARCCPELQLRVTDINPAALQFARVNVAAADLAADLHQTDTLATIDGDFDLILANPPYIIDNAGRSYRDGGGLHGAEVSLDMAGQALPCLAAGGRFILYTGSAIVAGRDRLVSRLETLASANGCRLRYEELDPDVFGEELENERYSDVERIALVSAVIERGMDPL